ncbi:uncharacterized protein DS421_19g658120 [Arachis hypogaea]|uniref:Uncharacterized protein n=1 Tax=Arachis hypogaea TaxID=3818 RepID=A0A6B9VCW7_ARAHY|nr:uncharacterized protein DS421_19g658120 [Arachis hypogaea]
MESNNNNSSSSMKLGSFLIPDMQNHSERSIGSQKGWNSERVVLNQTSRIRRHSGLTSFNSGRRTMPSKWDDAERWICSPVSGYGSSSNNNRNSYSRSQLQRHPKSKSGPIMPPGTSSSSYYSNYSPTIPLRQGLLVRNLMVGSSFTTGVLAPDALSLHHFDAHDNDFGHRFDIGNVMQPCSTGAVLNDNNGVLAPMWNQLLCDPSSPNSQDENPKNEENRIMSPFSRRDHGTQMSPPENEDDANSSPTSAMDQKNGHSGKLEVRDVEVDSEATVIRWPKGHATKLTSFQESNSEIQTSCSDIAKSTMDITKYVIIVMFISFNELETYNLVVLIVCFPMNFYFVVGFRKRKPKSLHGKANRRQRLKQQYANSRFHFSSSKSVALKLNFLIWSVSLVQHNIYMYIYYDKINKQGRH